MKKNLIKFVGYCLGCMCIYSVIPKVGLKEFCMVTLGACIIILSEVLLHDD